MFNAELCKKQTIINNRNGRTYKLIPLVKEYSPKNMLSDIVAVCNQELIYDVLFNSSLKGDLYSNKRAESFVKWAHQGWEKKSYFVFLIMDESEEQVCGAIDIKSNELRSGEVGYWASRYHSGIASSALKKMADLAKETGYEALHAFVEASNVRSANVLLRNGFSKHPDFFIHNDNNCYYYSKQLEE